MWFLKQASFYGEIYHRLDELKTASNLYIYYYNNEHRKIAQIFSLINNFKIPKKERINPLLKSLTFRDYCIQLDSKDVLLNGKYRILSGTNRFFHSISFQTIESLGQIIY